MIGTLTKLKSLAIIAVAAFLLGNLTGAAVIYKWSQVQETARLKVAMEIKEQERAAALISMQEYYENRPPIEVIKTKVKEVIKHVPTNPICDVSPDEQRLLNNIGSGMRNSARRNNESSGAPEAFASYTPLPRSTAVRAHVGARTEYQECFAAAKAVETYLLERAKQR